MSAGDTPCFLLEPRIIGNTGIRIDMGHIIMSAAADQGPLLNRVSMAQYTIAVVFVLLRSVWACSGCAGDTNDILAFLCAASS